MKLYPPFEISPRLLPALRIADANSTAWLSYDDETSAFVLDLPDGVSEWIPISPPSPMNLPAQFAAILGFLGACAESRRYAAGHGRDPMDGDNSDLFPSHVGEWAESMSDEIGMLQFEIEESETPLIEN